MFDSKHCSVSLHFHNSRPLHWNLAANRLVGADISALLDFMQFRQFRYADLHEKHIYEFTYAVPIVSGIFVSQECKCPRIKKTFGYILYGQIHFLRDRHNNQSARTAYRTFYQFIRQCKHP
jgi:hypothetical protein